MNNFCKNLTQEPIDFTHYFVDVPNIYLTHFLKELCLNQPFPFLSMFL